MKGPINKPKIGLGLDGLEIVSILSGALVVVGLLLESGPEIWRSIATRRIPSRDIIGGALVALGVFGEVAISIFISRSAKREKIESDAAISAANERAAEALKAAAEADLARAKIEQRMSVRFFAAEDFDKLIRLLKPHAPKLVDIVVYDHHIPETKLFAGQLSFVFISSGWHCHVYESRAAKARIFGPSVIVAVAIDHEGEYMALADTLANAINRPEIDCAVRLRSFGFAMGKEFNPGEFQLTSVHPFRAWGATILSPFRVQIGAKQLSTYPVATKVAGVRPVTPPQA